MDQHLAKVACFDQCPHEANSVQVQRLEFLCANMQSQLQSQNTKIGRIIETVNNSLTTSDDQRGSEIPDTVLSGFDNSDALALVNATIANLQAQTQKQVNYLNLAY